MDIPKHSNKLNLAMETFPIQNPEVAKTFDAFPKEIRTSLLKLRQLIISVGNKLDHIGKVEESLKWGEPSYSTIAGSPVRLGWKKDDPETYALYFHCQSKLVSVFRELYPQTFTFEGNRAIVFQKGDRLPQKQLKHCLELALTYHRWKNKPPV